MKNNIRHLLIAAVIVLLANLLLPGISAKRQVAKRDTLDRSISNRNSSHVSWFGIANFLPVAADIAVTKSAPEGVIPGANLTYTIQVGNSGPDAAANSTLNDTLPAQTTFISLSSPAGWSCTTPSVGAGGTVNCTNPSLAVTSGQTFTLVVNVASGTPTSTVIFNTATVGTSTFNSNEENDSATASTFVQGNDADVAVGKTGPDTASPDADLTYTIQVANFGPAAATNATLNDPLPANTTFVSLSSPPGWNCTTPSVGLGGTVNCTNPSFAVTSGVTFTLVVRVDPETPTNTFITNIATVSTNPSDTNAENNSASTSSFVPGTSADMGLTKSANAELVFAGTNVTYTIVVTNAGPDPANNASMVDTLPGNMTFVSLSSPAGWNCTTPLVGSGGTVNCSKPILAVSAGETFTLVGQIPAGTPAFTEYVNSALVSSTTQDPNSENNQANTLTTVVSCFTDPAVTSNADSGAGSLRQAIADACPDSTIRFSPELVGPISLTSGTLVIDKNLTIEGPGANMLTIERNASAPTGFSVFTINSGRTVAISGLTVSKGNGGINNSGTLTLTGMAVSANAAMPGIANAVGATLTVTESTIAGNSATEGAGIYNQGGATVLNSTISGNIASLRGAGILNTGTLTVRNTTITQNQANGGPGGAGIYNLSTVIIGNTIVAGNPGTGPNDLDLFGPFVSEGHNLIGAVSGSTGFTVAAPGPNGDWVGSNASPIPARLGQLANNGGPTQTHALLAGSSALDGGDNAIAINAGLTTDQRGTPFGRFRDAGSDFDAIQTVDIGAFEADPSIEDISDKVTPEDTPIAFSFNIGDFSSAFTSITAVSGNTTLVPNANLQITGSGTNRTLTITPTANLSGASTITVTLAKTIGGVPLTATDTFVVTVTAVNDDPVNTVPAAQSISENSTLTFNAANSNLISIADLDAGANPVQVTLNATNGTTTLNGISGLSFSAGDGTSDTTMTFTGTIANINNALNGMSFTSTAGFSGAASIQIVTNDQGNTGSGGAKSDTDTVNITVNDGGTLSFSATTYTVAESGINAIITVNRSGGTSGEARVNYATSNGTATAGEDYTAATGQLVFANGVTTQSFNVPITNDTLDETNETINLTLSTATGSGALGTPATAVLTITDDDSVPSLSINDVTLNEGNSGTTNFTFTVTLSSASGLTVTVNYQTANGSATAPSDYTAIPSTLLTFSPGETTKTITVLVNGDTLAELDDHFFVNLSNPTNATISDSEGVGTILSDDAPVVQFSSSVYSVGEGGGHVVITVTRLGNLSTASRVDYASSDLSGLNGCAQITSNASQRCDYTTVVGTLRFAAGEASKEIIIPIIDDVHVDWDEIFTLTLSNAVGVAVGSINTATITIIDNDTGPAPNPIDNDAFFIRQLYIDLLGRLPEPGAVNSWLSILNHCTAPSDPVNGCDRIAVAGAFLRSQEFQGRGFFVYRHYSPVLGRIPLYPEFVPDMAFLNGFLSSNDLEANKIAYTDAVMNRPEFKAIYDPTINNPTAYVDKLLQLSNLPNHPSRNTWIAGLTNNSLTRAQVLRQFIDSSEVYGKYFNEGFVIMNYFGFLRRTADASYQGWITLFNQTNDHRIVVGGFINSTEYRGRFGP